MSVWFGDYNNTEAVGLRASTAYTQYYTVILCSGCVVLQTTLGAGSRDPKCPTLPATGTLYPRGSTHSSALPPPPTLLFDVHRTTR